MIWVLCGVFGFATIVGVYFRYRASSPGPVDRSELQGAYRHAANVLGIFGVALLVLYLFAVVVLRW